MRSLSLESIPVNKNMKLLSLLVTLLALSYANKTSYNFSEIQTKLIRLENLTVSNAHNISVDIQLPRDIKNACECTVSFAKHLWDFLMSLKSVVPRRPLRNVLDNLKLIKDQPDDNCEFTRHQTKLTSENFKKFIQDNIVFTQNWMAHCKTNP